MKGKTSFGLKQKILLPAIGLLVLTVFVVLALVLAISSKNTTDLSNEVLEKVSSQYANDIQGKLNAAMNTANAMKPVFEEKGRATNRSSDEELLQRILEVNSDFFGTFLLYEPNAYDGKDAQYVGTKNSDETGRFISYIHREGNGAITEPLTGYETEGDGDYYLIPKKTLQENVTDPFKYLVADGSEITVSSIVVPLMKDGRFVGVVGMDIQVDSLIANLKEAKLFDSGYLFMADSNGTVFYHPMQQFNGASLYDMTNAADAALVKTALQTGSPVSFDEVTASDGVMRRYLISPVSIGNKYWLVGAALPTKEITKVTTTILTVGIVAGIIGAAAAAYVLLKIISRITKPIVPLTQAAMAIEKGQIDESVKQSLKQINSRDEIGLLAGSIDKAVGAIERVALDIRKLDTAAKANDLSVTIGASMHSGIYQEVMLLVNGIFGKFSETLSSINIAAEHVNTGAFQVSAGAQALATGSTEQAATVEELNAAVSEISCQASENFSYVQAATAQLEDSAHRLDAGNQHMTQLTAAMADITSSSNQIASITKVIEDIAFQTNILALNAAIEAARAGTAGKGFAVVADEVRNLAAKSAEAARQTSALIQNSVHAVERGTQMATQTAQILQEVVVGTAKTVEGVALIQSASSQQVQAIEQVQEGLNQVSSVVQTNAATAEENSATSEEMSAQAAMLRQEVGKFRLSDQAAHSIGTYDSGESAQKDKGYTPAPGLSLGKY